MKKLIKISAIVACAAVLFFNVSLTGKNSSNNIDLSSLTKISEANAECIPYIFNNGRCLVLNQLCVGNPFPEDQNCYTYFN
ncbi:MAG: hypothetical protein M0Q53_20450 [Prolixibacteraceae bacterium]|jgi:hypothetical protein|nr:hypothetical protein [Prolixibacteraceae bacterium]